jgi:hypothetical protein
MAFAVAILKLGFFQQNPYISRTRFGFAAEWWEIAEKRIRQSIA